MLRKYLSIILSTAVVLMPFQTTVSFAEDSEYKGFLYEHSVKSQEPMLYMDFSEYDESVKSDHGFRKFDSSDTTFPQNDNDEFGNYFSCSGYCYPQIRFDEPIESGKYLFSFDIKCSIAEKFCYLVNYTSDKYTDSEAFYSVAQKNNTIGHMQSWIISNPAEFNENEWCHVAMFYDFDNAKIHYYINNKDYGEQIMGGNKMYGFSFFTEGRVGNVTSFDNIAIYKVTPALGSELKSLGVTVPDNALSALSADISSAHKGNMFREFKDVSLDISFKNQLDQDLDCDIFYMAKDYKGDIVWTDKKERHFSANESFMDKIKPVVNRYDIYTLYVSVVPKDELISKTETDREFSVVHACTPGYKDKRLGCQNHPWSVSKFDDIKYPLDTLGIGLYRTDMSISTYEVDNGKYIDLDEIDHARIYREVKEMGMDNLVIWSALYNKYGEGGGSMSYKDMAKNPTILSRLSKASKSLAAELKDDVKYFELGNEFNATRNEEMSPEEYAAVAKAQYDGLKEGNPDCLVLSQGLSRCAGEYVYRYLKAPAGRTCDIVAQHIYQESGSPESKRFDLYSQYVRDAMERAGCGDMELWNTEGNTSAHYSYNTESQHGVNLVRQFVQCEAYNVNDRYFFYELQTDELDVNSIESYFGILRGKGSKNYCGPKQAYLAAANYIAMMENAEFVDDIRYDNVWIYRFKSSDGSYTLMMYCNRDTKFTSLDLGALNGIMYDINGNSTELNSGDGRYTFAITDQPIYFKYSGDKFERAEDVISLDKNVIELTKDSKDSYNVTVPEGAAITLENRDNVKVGINANNIEIEAVKLPNKYKDPALGYVSETAYTERRHDFGTQLYRDFVNMTVRKDGKTIAYLPLPYEWVYEEADVSMTVQPYDDSNSKFWTGKVNVRNNNADKEISGKIVVDSPEATAKKIKPIEIKNISPKETKTVEFNIDLSESSGWQLYKGRFIMNDGSEIPFQMTGVPRCSDYKSPGKASIATIEKNKGAEPVIDGKIDKDEWEDYKLVDFDKNQVTNFGSQNLVIAGVVEGDSFGEETDYGGSEDFSGSIYAKWDDKYLYTAAVVRDDVHFQKQSSVEFYRDDCFYLTLKPTLSQRHDTRIDFALSDFYDADVFDESDRKPRIFRNWSEMFDVCVCGLIDQSEDGFKIEVIRKDGITIYEARCPLDQIMSAETLKNKQCYLSFAVRDYDGDRDKTFAHDAWFVLTDTKK